MTLLVSLLSLYYPAVVSHHGWILTVFLIVAIGIPHGATDHLIFNCFICASNHIGSNHVGSKRFFYISYALSILFYLTCWYIVPFLSLILFILISAYHLGQSNLYYLVDDRPLWLKSLTYLIWGLFAILTPICSHPDEVNGILSDLLKRPILIECSGIGIICGLISLNVLLLGILFVIGSVTQHQLLQELLNLGILSFLFCTAPLMLSFAVYFGLWHSLASTLDQIKFIRQYNLQFDWSMFYRASIPYSLVSILGFVLLYATTWSHNGDLQGTIYGSISLFFIGLAVITLPHTIIRDGLYRRLLM
jgi:Brp/Blh family beta-carotene 15,15'-monooxygenase